MKKKNEVSKNQVSALDPDITAGLREIAGWPTQFAEAGGTLHRIRERNVHYDAQGNVTGASERLYEEEFSHHNQLWGK